MEFTCLDPAKQEGMSRTYQITFGDKANQRACAAPRVAEV
jgi:hypothetical protein